jgi:hypothetical protein
MLGCGVGAGRLGQNASIGDCRCRKAAPRTVERETAKARSKRDVEGLRWFPTLIDAMRSFVAEPVFRQRRQIERA